MSYYSYIPGSPLAAFVELFWMYEGYNPPHAKERVLPNGSVELVINLREDVLRIYERSDPACFQKFRGSLLSGAHSEFFVIDTASQFSIIGIHFKPGGAFPFFNLPAGELRDLHVSLDTLWGESAAAELRERLLEAATPCARFRLLEQVLLSHSTSRPLQGHPAVKFALKELQNPGLPKTVGAVSEQIGLSSRRFIELFRAEVGLTPKLYWRVWRFQEVLRQLGNRGVGPVDWSDLALSCGYFDQAHFIHDFQAFSGLNPTTYLSQCGEHQNHVPLDA